MPAINEILTEHVPHLAEYFGVWAVQPEPFLALAERVQATDLAAHILAAKAPAQPLSSAYEVTKDGVAIVPISGTLMKQASSFASENSSTVAARRKIRAAASDSAVAAIVLKIDSPGGAVSGTFDLVQDVAAANERKPVLAFIEDLGASAAYAIASAAGQVFANSSGLVGSIGTFAVVQDWSAAAAQMGVKVHVIRAGKFKGAGVAGTEITPEQLAKFQRTVDQLNDVFVASVAKGRKLDVATVQDLADGQVHVAAVAKDLRLIDGIATFDQVLERAAKLSTSHPPRKTMSQTTDNQIAAPLAPVAATIKEIKAGCPGITNDFAVTLLEEGATLATAQSRWMAKQSELFAAQAKELEAKEKELAEAKKAPPKKPGVPALTAKGKEADDDEAEATADADWSGDPLAAFEEKVTAHMKRKNVSRHVATQAVCREEPELREAMVAAHNTAHEAARKLRRRASA